jgi:hypothetical protein
VNRIAKGISHREKIVANAYCFMVEQLVPALFRFVRQPFGRQPNSVQLIDNKEVRSSHGQELRPIMVAALSQNA